MTALVRVTPVLVLALLALAFLAWRRERSWRSRTLLAVALSAFASTWPPIAWLAAMTLEGRYPNDPVPAVADAQAIVILSGHVWQPRDGRPTAYLGRDTYRRCRHGAWLWGQWRQLPVLVCGGETDPLAPGKSLAAPMRDYLVMEGVPAESVWVEDRSLTTWENAVFGAEILRARGVESIVLVTEAFHMPRASACFERQGLRVTPAPCRLRTGGFGRRLGDWMPSAWALVDLEIVVHEWIGLAWYALRGRL